MQNKPKKILIVSSYAPPAIGGPQTFYNLLCQLPPEYYCILTSFYAIDNLSAQKGTWLSGKYIFYDNLKGKKPEPGVVKNTLKETNSTRNFIQKLKFIMKRIPLMREIMGIPVIFLQIGAIVRSGKKAIKETGSEILLGVSDYGPAMLGSYILHKMTKHPLYIFLFDLYRGNFFPFPGELLANLFEKRILKEATVIIVNNEGTKLFYHARYGNEISKKIIIIHNSVFPETYEDLKNIKTKKNNKSPYTILFTGRINWPQLGAIKNLIKAVNEIKDLDLRFVIYSPMPKKFLNSIDIIESEKVKLSFAPPEEMPKIQNEADILFLPLSWNTPSQAIIDTATPGKLTDYLIAGKPILVHAPASSYLVKYAKERNFALSIDEENVELLKAGIKKILTEPIYAEELVKNAQATFFENHDANKNAEKFKKIFFSEHIVN